MGRENMRIRMLKYSSQKTVNQLFSNWKTGAGRLFQFECAEKMYALLSPEK
jgi:hypothetical protein